jgi:hypothetical protein
VGEDHGDDLDHARDAERIGLPPGMKSPHAPQRKTAPFTRAMGYPCPCASHVFEML